MQNNIKRLSLILLTLFMMIAIVFWQTSDVNAASYQNKETGFTAKIMDDADLFTEKEEKELTKAMADFTEFGNALLATSNSNNFDTVKKLAVDYYDKAFGIEDGAVFLFDMDNREIYWYTEGDLYDVLSVKSAMAITDNVYTYATKGDFVTCAKEAFIQAASVVRGEGIAQKMKYYGNALLALILALFANYILLRKTSFIRPKEEIKTELYESKKEFLDMEKKLTGQRTKELAAFASDPFFSSGSSSSSYSSGSSYSSASSSYSSSSSSSSSRSSSSGSSSSHSSGSSSHRGGGAGHRF
ncbi:MAG: TPM domain-containing protein [Eubacteriales bacterium]|nr:TPM domain-containing protein [Eubacteriales bacterium]